MSTESKSENSKNGINLFDMYATITIAGLDENIEKLERIKKLLQDIGELTPSAE